MHSSRVHADASLWLSLGSGFTWNAEARPWFTVMSVDRGTVNYSAPEVLCGASDYTARPLHILEFWQWHHMTWQALSATA